jgi:GNAT superfamily N-acetyltransferase
MIYYQDQSLLVRDMEQSDPETITCEEIAQGWNQTPEKYEMRLRHQAEGRCTALVAEYQGNAAGYIHVYPHSPNGPFGGQGLPEIVDFGVLEKYRNKGIGSILMDIAEQIAARYANRVYLSVGLHSGYGSAQRIYIKRGYLPDGSGVWYQDQVCPPYGECRNDDDLVIYLSKLLS